MRELVDWLRAQLDEDERIARKAAALCGCHPPAPSWSFRDGDEPTDGRILIVDDPHPDLKRKISRRWNGSYEGLFMAEHVVRHDPARVLREIDAKRKQVEWCVEVIGGRDLSRYEEFGSLKEDRDALAVTLAVETLRLLALPYADRPGFQESWRP